MPTYTLNEITFSGKCTGDYGNMCTTADIFNANKICSDASDSLKN